MEMINQIIDVTGSIIFKVKDYIEFVINPEDFNISRKKENNPILLQQIKNNGILYKVVGIHHNALNGDTYIGDIGLVTKKIIEDETNTRNKKIKSLQGKVCRIL